MCDMTHSYVWHDSFLCVTWLIPMCDMTHSYVWHDSLICVSWLINMWDMTHSYVWHDSFATSYVWHDSFICVPSAGCADRARAPLRRLFLPCLNILREAWGAVAFSLSLSHTHTHTHSLFRPLALCLSRQLSLCQSIGSLSLYRSH